VRVCLCNTAPCSSENSSSNVKSGGIPVFWCVIEKERVCVRVCVCVCMFERLSVRVCTSVGMCVWCVCLQQDTLLEFYFS